MKDVSADYITQEEADERKPVELYHMWREAGETWNYTSGDVPVTYSGVEYTPATLERTSVTYDDKLEVVTMTIKAAYLADTVIDYISTNPVEIIWVSVMKLHREQDPLEADVVFLGQIKTVSFKGVQANILCVGFEQFLKQTVPRWRYQLTCNHTLFDECCLLTKEDYKTTATVTLDSTKTILTSTTFSGVINGYFTGGELVFNVERRTITAHAGTSITLMYKMKELEDNDTVYAYPGCDRRLETCRDKFDNIENSLAFPFIPTKNPAYRVP